MRFTILFLTALLVGCGGGGNDGPPPPPPNDSAGGIWQGTRPSGTEIVVFVSETGEFRMLDPFGNVGHGTLTVSNQTEINIQYEIFAPFGGTIFDGSESSSCTATGTIDERIVLPITTACVSSLGTNFGGDIELTYQDVYARNSSLAEIAGSYDNQGEVWTIDGAGLVFEQNSQTGCVLDGQVSIIDASWNLYDATFTTNSCAGSFAPLNGARWNGLVALAMDDTGRDVLIGAFDTSHDFGVAGLIVALPEL